MIRRRLTTGLISLEVPLLRIVRCAYGVGLGKCARDVYSGNDDDNGDDVDDHTEAVARVFGKKKKD